MERRGEARERDEMRGEVTCVGCPEAAGVTRTRERHVNE